MNAGHGTPISADAAADGAESKAALAARCIAQLRLGDRVSRGLGISLDASSPGHTSLAMNVAEHMLNAYEICHGGYIFTLADTAFAYAASTRNNVAVGLNCHIDFIRPARKGDRLHAHAEITFTGKTTGAGTVRVVDQDGRQIAELHGRYYNLDQPIVEREQEAGGMRVG